jgi:hypothetical protein
MEDGNVILQADNVQFKVHKAVLSEHSPFFAAMFSLPQSEFAVDTNVVLLHDNPDHVGLLLQFLYGIWYVCNICDTGVQSAELEVAVLPIGMSLGRSARFELFSPSPGNTTSPQFGPT